MAGSDAVTRARASGVRHALPPDFVRPLRTAAVLGAIACSVSLSAFVTVAAASFDALVAGNDLSVSLRQSCLIAVGIATAAAVVAAVTMIRRGRLSACERWSRLLSPLLLAALLPALLARAPWRERELAHLVLVLVFTLAAERLLRLSFRAWPRRAVVRVTKWSRRWPERMRQLLPLSLVLLIAVYYALRVGQYTLLNHDRLATSTADLGEFDNLFFNALHGHPFRAVTTLSDFRDWHGLKVHAEFALYLLLPFYAIAPGPKTLLVIQAVVVALTAVPVYLLAARRLGRPSAVVVATATLLLPVVQRPNFYDFHMTPLAMLLVAWLLYVVDVYVAKPARDRRAWAWALGMTVLLALSVREDVAIGVALLGLLLVFSRRAVPAGALITLAALAYFAVLQLWLMPSFGKHWYDALYQDLKAPGARGFGAVILTLLSNPAFVVTTWLSEAKLLYLLHMSVPLAALWLRQPWLLLAALPGFASTVLVTNRPPMFQSSFQYTYLWVPYIVGASVLALAGVARGHGPLERRAAKLAALGALAIAALSTSYQHGALLGAEDVLAGFGRKPLTITPEEREQLAQLRRLVHHIPQSASVSGTEDVGPQLSTRLVFYHLTHGEPDYIVVGRPNGRSERAYLQRVVGSGEYVEIERQARFQLLARRRSRVQ